MQREFLAYFIWQGMRFACGSSGYWLGKYDPPQKGTKPTRPHGPFKSEDEAKRYIRDLKPDAILVFTYRLPDYRKDEFVP